MQLGNSWYICCHIGPLHKNTKIDVFNTGQARFYLLEGDTFDDFALQSFT